MNSSERSFPASRVLLSAASFIILIVGLQAAQPILLPFFFAILLAILGSTPVRWMKRKRVPTWISVLIVACVLMGALFGTAYFLATSVDEFTAAIPRYRAKLDEIYSSLIQWFLKNGLKINEELSSSLLDPNAVLDMLGKGLKGIVSALSSTALVMIIMIFMLYEAAEFRAKLRVAFDQSLDMDRMEGVSTDIQRYLAIKTVTCAITGIFIGVWVAFMDIDFPALWGVVAFILNYIPFIGSIIASVPAILLALMTSGWTGVALVGAGYLVVNIFVSNFLEPILMGRRLGLSPLVVFLSLVFWGWVWGPGGMLLAVPLTMVIKILLEHSDEFRWISILMGTRPRKQE